MLWFFLSVERDPHDNAAKSRESQDCSQKVLELQKKLDQSRAQVKRIYSFLGYRDTVYPRHYLTSKFHPV